jgi:hypothetical protein
MSGTRHSTLSPLVRCAMLCGCHPSQPTSIDSSAYSPIASAIHDQCLHHFAYQLLITSDISPSAAVACHPRRLQASMPAWECCDVISVLCALDGVDEACLRQPWQSMAWSSAMTSTCWRMLWPRAERWLGLAWHGPPSWPSQHRRKGASVHSTPPSAQHARTPTSYARNHALTCAVPGETKSP